MAFRGAGGGGGLPTGAVAWSPTSLALSATSFITLNGGTTGVTVGGTKVGFYGGTPAAQQTLTSGTATPESLALALEAATLMTGT